MKFSSSASTSLYIKGYLVLIVFLLFPQLNAQTCRSTVNKHLFQFCESDTVEDIILSIEDGDPLFEWEVNLNGEIVKLKDDDDGIYTLTGITDPGVIIITTAISNGNACENIPDTIFIEQYPQPTATISGGGIACASTELEPPSAAFEGTEPFTLYYSLGNSEDSIVSATSALLLSADLNYPLYFTALADQNCRTKFYDTLFYSFRDLPNPEIKGDENVCLNDSSIYSTDATLFDVEWQLISDGDYMEQRINNYPAIQVSWANAGLNELRARLIDEESGCTSAWSNQKFTIIPPPKIQNYIDTVLCFDQHGFLETHFSVREGEEIFWPDLGEYGAEITISNPGSYRFVYTNEYNCQSVGDFFVEDNCLPNIHVPEAFTPGDDAINDVLPVYGLYSNLWFRVYSASGILLFESYDDDMTWDGRYDGELLPAGSYYWVAEFTDKLGQEMKKQGMVRLIR